MSLSPWIISAIPLIKTNDSTLKISGQYFVGYRSPRYHIKSLWIQIELTVLKINVIKCFKITKSPIGVTCHFGNKASRDSSIEENYHIHLLDDQGGKYIWSFCDKINKDE